MSEDSAYQILVMGLEPRAFEVLQKLCDDCQFTAVNTGEEFAQLYEGWSDGMFNAMVCGPQMQGMSAFEVAQVLLNQCPNTEKYYVTYDTTGYEPKNLLKNGFTACFALPLDSSLLQKSLLENVLTGPKKKKSFRGVRVFDLGAGDVLSFETYVYLPLNKKYVRFSGAYAKMDAAKLDKLESKQMSQVFVDHKDMQKFYKYSAKKLRGMGADGGMSTTEKQERLRESVRWLFTDIFDQSVKADFDHGRDMIKQCEGIISNYITKGSSGNWYKKLLSSIGESPDGYNHATNVSTFAALFAIGLGHKAPEDLAMAGLFHDLGLTALPEDLQNKPENELTPEEREIYYSHPEKSVNIVKNKRIIVPAEVERAILQHHEKWNGKGWPKQHSGTRISEEAELLSFADQFDYLTSMADGKRRYTPLQAVDMINKNGSVNSELVAKIRQLVAEGNSEGPRIG